MPGVLCRQILSFSLLHPAGGYSYLAGHVHGPGSISQRYSTQTSKLGFQYLSFFFFFLILFYLVLHLLESFLPRLVRSFGEFSSCMSIRQLPNSGTEKGVTNITVEILLCVTSIFILVYEE